MNNLFDYEIDVFERIKLLNSFSDPFDVVKRISGMYEFSGTKIHEEYLIHIVKTSTISSIIKADAVKSLFNFQEFKETISESDSDDMKIIKSESNDAIEIRNSKRTKKAYDALQHLCTYFDDDIATPYKIDMIQMLMQNYDYYDVSDNAFKKIINDTNIHFDFRYKSILSLEKNQKIIVNKDKYITSLLSSFIENKQNPCTYRILACQNILQNFIVDVSTRLKFENILIEFCRDSDLDYNVRADSCDTLINIGVDESLKQEANTILSSLGSMFGVVKTIYDNAQNVHNKELEETSLPIIRFLLQVDSKNTDYSFVISEIISEIVDKEKSQKEKINLSLNRISIDRSLYHNTSLTTILVKLWSYIESSEYKDELKKRLFEELEEMSGTCTSGFIMRLLNTLSGFEDNVSLKISYEDQIVANFIGRLNAVAKKITEPDSPFFNEKLHDVVKLYLDSEKIDYDNNIENYVNNLSSEEKNDIVCTFSDNVLYEMCENTSNWSKRQDFSLFFRTYLSKLREELFSEFKTFVTDSEFDLFIRKAISTYEGVKFMS